jgi:hypothetical protein
MNEAKVTDAGPGVGAICARDVNEVRIDANEHRTEGDLQQGARGEVEVVPGRMPIGGRDHEAGWRAGTRAARSLGRHRVVADAEQAPNGQSLKEGVSVAQLHADPARPFADTSSACPRQRQDRRRRRHRRFRTFPLVVLVLAEHVGPVLVPSGTTPLSRLLPRLLVTHGAGLSPHPSLRV